MGATCIEECTNMQAARVGLYPAPVLLKNCLYPPMIMHKILDK